MKVARGLVSFIDGSYLFVELAKKVEHTDTMLYCERIVGLPDGTPTDKPTIAVAMTYLASAGESIEVLIPISRINAISIQEEFLAKQVAKDIQDMWTPPKPAGRNR